MLRRCVNINIRSLLEVKGTFESHFQVFTKRRDQTR